MTKFKPMKVKNSSIRLPDKFLDAMLINDGEFLLLVEESGRFYLRKTRKSSEEFAEEKSSEEAPPKTFEELAKESQQQAQSSPKGAIDPNSIFKMMENTLKDPNMRKMIEDTAKGLFKAFDGEEFNLDDLEESLRKKKAQSEDKKEDEVEDESEDEIDENDDDDEEGFKIDID
ncbi:MAG: hypothetical protein ACXAC7_12675 [Candidatus Hodarchaeales archaeon]|jgi:hypothetical protein